MRSHKSSHDVKLSRQPEITAEKKEAAQHLGRSLELCFIYPSNSLVLFTDGNNSSNNNNSQHWPREKVVEKTCSNSAEKKCCSLSLFNFVPCSLFLQYNILADCSQPLLIRSILPCLWCISAKEGRTNPMTASRKKNEFNRIHPVFVVKVKLKLIIWWAERERQQQQTRGKESSIENKWIRWENQNEIYQWII